MDDLENKAENIEQTVEKQEEEKLKEAAAKKKNFFPVKTKLKFWVKMTKMSHFKNVAEFDISRSVVKDLRKL